MPWGSLNLKQLPLPSWLSTVSEHTEKILLTLRYFSIIPLQFIKPKPWDFSVSTCSFPCKHSSTITLCSNKWATCAGDMPSPSSRIAISAAPSASSTWLAIHTCPPEGVYLRALSASVLSMKSVSARSAFTMAFEGSTISWMPLFLKLKLLFSTMSNKSCKAKRSMLRLSCPCFNWIHCVSALLYSLILPANSPI